MFGPLGTKRKVSRSNVHFWHLAAMNVIALPRISSLLLRVRSTSGALLRPRKAKTQVARPTSVGQRRLTQCCRRVCALRYPIVRGGQSAWQPAVAAVAQNVTHDRNPGQPPQVLLKLRP